MTPVNVANLGLLEIGQRIQIQSFNDNSPAGQAASLFYTPKTQMLLRAANWDFARAQVTLTLLKQAIVNGAPSTNPPPQPFLFEYLYPTDCLKVRFLLPTMILAATSGGVPLTTAPGIIPFVAPAPTAIPFVIGTDKDSKGNPIKVILTNLPLAQCIYTRDLSQFPDQWDSLFLSGETALLASYFINTLARNKAQYDDQVAISKNVIDQARMANGNEQIGSIDHSPDWLNVRRSGNALWAWSQGGGPGAAWGAGGGWDQLSFPCGLRY